MESAATSLRALTPWLEVETHAALADEALLDALLPEHQLVLDCTDNVAIRNLLNQRARQHRVPLVSGAAIRLEGQLCSFSWQEDEPCYACLSALFGEQSLTCVEAGVLAPVVGLVGSLQALEAIKLLAGMGKSHSGRLLMIDGLGGSFRELKLPKRPDCPVCSQP
ncbi:Molybdopterin-synthase adenylyltransferase [compost metagenome]